MNLLLNATLLGSKVSLIDRPDRRTRGNPSRSDDGIVVNRADARRMAIAIAPSRHSSRCRANHQVDLILPEYSALAVTISDPIDRYQFDRIVELTRSSANKYY
jgi:hypothetical protein